jgi:hypothetical protein
MSYTSLLCSISKIYAKATNRPAIRKISQVLESGKKTRERRTPKTNPRIILIISTDGRMLPSYDRL